VPIYEEEGKLTREALYELRRYNKCKECGGQLDVFLDHDTQKAFLACRDWPRTHHEGLEREASRYEKEGLASLTIPTRREILNQDFGPKKTTAIARYIGTSAITKAIATEIVESLWGEAPQIEKTKAILLCQTYQLNPLMKHLHLVGYKRKDKAGNYIRDKQGNYVRDWVAMIGIGATRLMAQRKHNYSYLDMTPRKATKEEIEKILGDTADPNSIYGFVHIKDVDTQAEAFGLRGCSNRERIINEEKGNTHLNQACVRAERQALDRQYPGEMPPQDIEVVDERFIDTTYKVLDEKSAESEEELAARARGEGLGTRSAARISETEAENSPAAERASGAVEGEGFHIDLDWLDEALQAIKWSEDTAKTFLVSKYKVSPQGTLADVLKRLTREQAEEFTKELQSRGAQKEMNLEG